MRMGSPRNGRTPAETPSRRALPGVSRPSAWLLTALLAALCALASPGECQAAAASETDPGTPPANHETAASETNPGTPPANHETAAPEANPGTLAAADETEGGPDATAAPDAPDSVASSREAMLERAIDALSGRRMSAGLDRLDEIIELYPDWVSARRTRAYARLRAGDFERVELELTALIGENILSALESGQMGAGDLPLAPEPEDILAMAIVRDEGGAYREADRLYRAYADLVGSTTPRAARAFRRLAYMYESSGVEWGDAAVERTRALSIDPEIESTSTLPAFPVAESAPSPDAQDVESAPSVQDTESEATSPGAQDAESEVASPSARDAESEATSPSIPEPEGVDEWEDRQEERGS